VAQKWTQKGAIVPLFDRLCDYEPTISHEPVPLVSYTKKQLLESIQREVENLLNTRSSLSLANYASLDHAHMPYGVPDLFGLPDSSFADPTSTRGALQLEALLTNSIRIFESRLQNVRVDVGVMDVKTQSVNANITADLVIGDVRETISFPVSVLNFQGVADRENEDYDAKSKLKLLNTRSKDNTP
jgi:type VI secretion system lysozyme-like protein